MQSVLSEFKDFLETVLLLLLLGQSDKKNLLKKSDYADSFVALLCDLFSR